MSPTKLLDDIIATVSRYAPSVVVHAVLFAWLSARVLADDVLPDGETAWAAFTVLLDEVMEAVGLKLDRWYVLVALAIGYLTAFRAMASLLSSLPVLRPPLRFGQDPALVEDACETMRLRPDYWETVSALADLVQTSEREVVEAGRQHPYQWQLDRDHVRRQYYGALLVALVATVAWGIEGGSLARSTGAVWELTGLLGGACLVTRELISRGYQRLLRDLRYWALYEYRRRERERPPDPLAGRRRELLRSDAETQEALHRHPSSIVRDLTVRLPKKVRDRLWRRIRSPVWRLGNDWDVLASAASLHADATYEPPHALSVAPFARCFTALLECPGAGLSRMAPRGLGLAPVARGGDSFDFATRRHDAGALTLHLVASDRLDGATLRVINYKDERAFLVEIGPHPIERLAQHDFPRDGPGSWYDLLPPFQAEEVWASSIPGAWSYAGFTLSDHVDLVLGSSYIMGARTMNGADVGVVFQCFRVEDTETLLVAWRILRVRTPAREPATILPWWNLEAWRELWQASDRER